MMRVVIMWFDEEGVIDDLTYSIRHVPNNPGEFVKYIPTPMSITTVQKGIETQTFEVYRKVEDNVEIINLIQTNRGSQGGELTAKIYEASRIIAREFMDADLVIIPQIIVSRDLLDYTVYIAKSKDVPLKFTGVSQHAKVMPANFTLDHDPKSGNFIRSIISSVFMNLPRAKIYIEIHIPLINYQTTNWQGKVNDIIDAIIKEMKFIMEGQNRSGQPSTRQPV